MDSPGLIISDHRNFEKEKSTINQVTWSKTKRFKDLSNFKKRSHFSFGPIVLDEME